MICLMILLLNSNRIFLFIIAINYIIKLLHDKKVNNFNMYLLNYNLYYNYLKEK